VQTEIAIENGEWYSRTKNAFVFAFLVCHSLAALGMTGKKNKSITSFGQIT
jgi:hypothetical protein